jgi:hypothetical protein
MNAAAGMSTRALRHPEPVEIVIGSLAFSRSIPAERRSGEVDAYY